ncbi:MAG: Gfo/Idh/MocA family oxidoreductase [Propionibacteriaceae bacterium]|nr:Gfo/Idh/MocA family oxidoreductase [Propionibacteriaceae bacterium]
MEYVQVGLGYRSQAFKRVMADMAEHECVGLVLRRGRAASVSVPVFTDLDECLSQIHPDFVLSFAPGTATGQVIRTAVSHGTPVLVETPPAGAVAELDDLSDMVDSGLVQVAEQYPMMPGNMARLEVVRRGLIGEISQVQVSSTQTYHAMALIRAYLGCGGSAEGSTGGTGLAGGVGAGQSDAGFVRPGGHQGVQPTGHMEDDALRGCRVAGGDAVPRAGDGRSDAGSVRLGGYPVVRAARFAGPLVNPLSRAGWTDDDATHQAATVLASVDFGDGRSGVYDFTDNQTRNLLRTRRLLLRGSHGEISGDQVVRLADHNLITTTYLNRRQTGHDLDLNGYCTYQITLGDQVVWTNPWPDKRWNDDELGVAELLRRMTAWLRGEGAAPYPLSEAIYDTRLGLAIEEAVAKDQPVRV